MAETNTTSAPNAPHATIERDELKEKIERGDVFALFEVLPAMYWRRHHLPGARSLPPEQVGELVPQLVPDKDAEIVLYCWDFT
jgi:rhodanese-related sulfurtransferase